MTTAVPLDQYVRARRAEVDAALDALLPAPPRCPGVVADAMRYSVTAGGKRLRPILCLASADAVGGDRAAALPAACAIEFIHTYSLIHDDLPAMDNDTLRRGRPTLHVVAGEGMAILAGDGLLTEAFVVLARQPQTNDPALAARKLRVIEVVAAAAGAIGMVGGQAVDLASVTPDPHGRTSPPLDADGLRDMHARKTGALIRAAAVAGAIMAGGSDEAIHAVGEYGRHVGLVFQIVDDILDVEGDAKDLGKTAGKDAKAGKPTYPSTYGLDASRRLALDGHDAAIAALRSAGLHTSRLSDIAAWVITRTN